MPKSTLTPNRLTWMVIALLMSTAPAIGQSLFDLPYALSCGSMHWTVADLRNDGYPDLVIFHGVGPGSFVIVEFSGGPTPQSVTTLTTSAGSPYSAQMYAGDFNGDGFEDACFRLSTSTVPYVVAGAAPGQPLTVSTAPALPASAVNVPLASVDLDGDGDSDLVGPVLAGTGLRVYWCQGAFNFSVGPLLFGGQVPSLSAITSVDLDVDGDQDVVAVCGTGLRVITNTGTVNPLSSYSLVVSGVSGAGGLAAADFDGDGDPDLACRSAYGTGVYFRNDGANFTLLSFFPTGGQGNRIGGGDIDGDGLGDLVVPDALGWRPYLMSAGFTATALPIVAPFATTTLTPWNADVRLMDIDGDGDSDLISVELGFLVIRLATGVGPNFDSIQVSSGDAQSTLAGTPYAQPLVVQVFAPNGLPRAGTTVDFVGQYGAVATPSSATTDANGFAQTVVTAGPTPGLDAVRIVSSSSHPTGVSATLTALGAHTILASSGDGQTGPVYQALPQPITATVMDSSTGQPLSGVVVTFTVDGQGLFLPGTTVTTDILGQATVAFTPTGPAGPRTITASSAGAGAGAEFSIVATGFTGSVQAVGGDGQYGLVDSPFAAPLRVQVLDAAGTPAPGVGVIFTVTSGSATVGATTLTDAFGIVEAAVACGSGAGAVEVRAEVAGVTATFHLFGRGLYGIWSPPPGILSLFFLNDHIDVPLIVAVDVPLVPIGSTPSPFGSLYTSILAPGPSFFALDGLGLFGAPDPTIIGSPNWARTFALAPAAVAGVTLVFQVYGIDGGLAFPEAVIVSNPVVLTL